MKFRVDVATTVIQTFVVEAPSKSIAEGEAILKATYENAEPNFGVTVTELFKNKNSTVIKSERSK